MANITHDEAMAFITKLDETAGMFPPEFADGVTKLRDHITQQRDEIEEWKLIFKHRNDIQEYNGGWKFGHWEYEDFIPDCEEYYSTPYECVEEYLQTKQGGAR